MYFWHISNIKYCNITDIRDITIKLLIIPLVVFLYLMSYSILVFINAIIFVVTIVTRNRLTFQFIAQFAEVHNLLLFL